MALPIPDSDNKDESGSKFNKVKSSVIKSYGSLGLFAHKKSNSIEAENNQSIPLKNKESTIKDLMSVAVGYLSSIADTIKKQNQLIEEEINNKSLNDRETMIEKRDARPVTRKEKTEDDKEDQNGILKTIFSVLSTFIGPQLAVISAIGGAVSSIGSIAVASIAAIAAAAFVGRNRKVSGNISRDEIKSGNFIRQSAKESGYIGTISSEAKSTPRDFYDWNKESKANEPVRPYAKLRELSTEERQKYSKPSDGIPQKTEPVKSGKHFDRILMAESRGRQFGKDGKVITSNVGAIGIAQIMPATGPEAARDAGLKWDPVRFKTDANYNKTLGEAYYNKLLRMFDGDQEKATAAYNHGPGAVRKKVKKYGSAWKEHLPKETKDYLVRTGASTPAGSSPTKTATEKPIIQQAKEQIDSTYSSMMSLIKAVAHTDTQFRTLTSVSSKTFNLLKEQQKLLELEQLNGLTKPPVQEIKIQTPQQSLSRVNNGSLEVIDPNYHLNQSSIISNYVSFFMIEDGIK